MIYYTLTLVTLMTVLCGADNIKLFDQYEVYRLIPQKESQLQALEELKGNEGYDFWIDTTTIGRPVDIMIAPHIKPNFHTFIKTFSFEHQLLIGNVQSLINKNNESRRTPFPVGFDWLRYHTLTEINTWLNSLQEKYPNIVTVIKGGKSFNNRDIIGIKISFKSGNKAVFLEGGIHAREWISPATVTFIANELLTSTNSSVRAIAESRDWYIFPVFNPDGYVYTFVNRMWRKTRKPYGFCVGADSNRNWGYKWMHGGSSNNSCSDTYAGSSAFSEIETKSLSEFISSIQNNLEAYIAFHSYSQVLLTPFGHDGLEVPTNHDELLTIGQNAVTVLARRYGTQYKVGNIPQILYVASGGSVDWVAGTYRHIRLIYTYELRDTGTYGFLLPPNQIIPTGEETMDSLISMFQQLDENTKNF